MSDHGSDLVTDGTSGPDLEPVREFAFMRDGADPLDWSKVEGLVESLKHLSRANGQIIHALPFELGDTQGNKKTEFSQAECRKLAICLSRNSLKLLAVVEPGPESKEVLDTVAWFWGCQDPNETIRVEVPVELLGDVSQ